MAEVGKLSASAKNAFISFITRVFANLRQKNVVFRVLPKLQQKGSFYLVLPSFCLVLLSYRTHVHMGSDHWVAMSVRNSVQHLFYPS